MSLLNPSFILVSLLNPSFILMSLLNPSFTLVSLLNLSQLLRLVFVSFPTLSCCLDFHCCESFTYLLHSEYLERFLKHENSKPIVGLGLRVATMVFLKNMLFLAKTEGDKRILLKCIVEIPLRKESTKAFLFNSWEGKNLHDENTRFPISPSALPQFPYISRSTSIHLHGMKLDG